MKGAGGREYWTEGRTDGRTGDWYERSQQFTEPNEDHLQSTKTSCIWCLLLEYLSFEFPLGS